MRTLFSLIASFFCMVTMQSKTLIVYYSYTNNVRTVVGNLSSQIEADVLEVLPAEEGLKYEANNYAIGTSQLNAINASPNDASSYPGIKTTISNLADYNTIIIATPLWWSQMAAPMQTFLFTYGKEMAGKNVGLIVSSASSGISGVERDAMRLVPDANWMSKSLHIRSSQTASSSSMIASWLTEINYNSVTAIGDVHGEASETLRESYYSINGSMVAPNTKGFVILHKHKSNGNVVTKKIMR